MTNFCITQLSDIGYQGNAHTLSTELIFLPKNVDEWTKRVQLLAEELRHTLPCRNAMHSQAEYSDPVQTRVGYCIDGVITLLAENHHAIKGEWLVSDYITTFEETNMLPVTVSQDRRLLNQPQPGARITQYQYFVQRHQDEKPEPRYPSHTVNSPAEARLWVGMDINPWDGAHRDISLTDLGDDFANSVKAQYGFHLPDPATVTKISDLVFDAGANPLSFAADFPRGRT